MGMARNDIAGLSVLPCSCCQIAVPALAAPSLHLHPASMLAFIECMLAQLAILAACVNHTQVRQGGAGDEIKQFLDARYVGSIESCWRIFKLDMHKSGPMSVRLAVHDADGQVCHNESSRFMMCSYAWSN